MDETEKWNWQRKRWPEFSYDSSRLEVFEAEFLEGNGLFRGALRHVGSEDAQRLFVELNNDEALNTSKIEGEVLNRDSLQASILKNFGLPVDARRIPAAEQGIAQMRHDLFLSHQQPLTAAMLQRWHRMLTNGRSDLKDVGAYRRDPEPMQVVSGALHAPKIHFEAPPAQCVEAEMMRFLTWFAASELGSPRQTLARAGIAHLYFESIHPFEDGNGRIGRAIVEKAIAESTGQPPLLALSQTINGQKKRYYEMLERSNQDLEISEWLLYFSETILESQTKAQRIVDFIIEKSKFFSRLRGKLNPRQEKAITRMMDEGVDGFQGGLSAKNYMSISGATRATATRDLSDMVEKNALSRSGELKSTRYHLPFVFKNK